jgi:esterase/lipase superfamily enzyme
MVSENLESEKEKKERERAANEVPLFIIDTLRPLNIDDEIYFSEDYQKDYIAISTATSNVEDDEHKTLISNIPLGENTSERWLRDLTEQTDSYLRKIAQRLVETNSQTNSSNLDPEIVIAVHGFNNNFNAVRAWYNEIHEYIRIKNNIKKNNLVFIGSPIQI